MCYVEKLTFCITDVIWLKYSLDYMLLFDYLLENEYIVDLSIVDLLNTDLLIVDLLNADLLIVDWWVQDYVEIVGSTYFDTQETK